MRNLPPSSRRPNESGGAWATADPVLRVVKAALRGGNYDQPSAGRQRQSGRCLRVNGLGRRFDCGGGRRRRWGGLCELPSHLGAAERVDHGPRLPQLVRGAHPAKLNSAQRLLAARMKASSAASKSACSPSSPARRPPSSPRWTRSWLPCRSRSSRRPLRRPPTSGSGSSRTAAVPIGLSAGRRLP